MLVRFTHHMPICPGYEKTHSASLELRVGLYPFTALLASLKGFHRYVGLLRATLTVFERPSFAL